MSHIKKSFILVFALLFNILGCSTKLDGYEGTYICTYLSIDDESQEVSKIYEYYYIKLDGKGVAINSYMLKIPPYTEGYGVAKYKIEQNKYIETVGEDISTYSFDPINYTIIIQETIDNVDFLMRFTRTNTDA